jgi:hypothetical protein
VHDPAVVALRGLTRAALDTNAPRGAATATVHTSDGRVLTAAVPHARGSTELPLTDREIEAKLRDLCEYGDFRGAVDDVIAAVWRIDAMPAIAQLTSVLRGE